MTKQINETITRDPIFGHIFSKEENCLYLLQQILPKLNLVKVDVVPQKEINDRLKEKNVRFDIWAVDEHNRKYDIELQIRQEHNLGSRFRYYQSEADKDTLKPGQTYLDIDATYIIFICPFDQFGNDKIVYESCILGDKTDITSVLDTKAHWITINSHGHRGKATPGLQDFLDYMNGKINKNNPFICKIDNEVKDYISSPEWRKIDMNLDTMLADQKIDTEIEAIKKMYTALKELGISEDQILKTLIKNYGNHFSEKEIKKFIK